MADQQTAQSTTAVALSALSAVLVSAVTAIGAPFITKWWHAREKTVRGSTQVELARISAGDKMMDRLMDRVSVLEARVQTLEKERNDAAQANATLGAEYDKVKGLVNQLENANRELEVENTSLKEVIVALNISISKQMAEIRTLNGKLSDLQATMRTLRNSQG